MTESTRTGDYAEGAPPAEPVGVYASTDGQSSDRSIGELFGDVSKDLSRLMRQEVELAKAEIRQEATQAGKAGAMLGGSGVAGLLLAVFASLALMFALDALMPTGWAALIVAVVWAVIGAALYYSGRRRLRQVSPVPERTIETLKEDARWVRSQTK